jgi:hypothetical protein
VNLDALDEMIKKDESLPFNVSADVKKLHPGHPSSMTGIEDNLCCSIFKFREQGLA